MANLIVESLYEKYGAVQESTPKRKRLTESLGSMSRFINDAKGVFEQEIKEKKLGKPITHIFVDQSSSWGDEALELLDDILRMLSFKFEVYYFSDKVYTSAQEARRGGSTFAGPEILNRIQQEQPTNVIIITDDDFDLYNRKGGTPVTVPGGVFLIFRNGNVSNWLVKNLNGGMFRGLYELRSGMNESLKRKALVEHIDLSDRLGNIVRPGGMRDESKICDIVASHTAYEDMFREIGYDDDCSLVFYLDDANAVNIQSIVDDINDEFSAKDMPNYAQVCSYANSPAIEVQELFRSINAYIENTPLTNESLTEARNPENDEVNAVIRKWANSDRNRLSKKDQEILDKNGLSLEDSAWRKGSKRIAGPVYNKDNEAHYIMTKDHVKRTHPDYDLKGHLSKKPQSYNDTEVPIASWNSSYIEANKDEPYTVMNARYRKDAEQKISPNQFKSLQPYADEKKAFRQNKEDSKYASKRAKELQARAKDRLKKAVDYYDGDMRYVSDLESEAADFNKDAYRALHQAKEKHAAKKKNESLSLKEDMADSLQRFWDLVNDYDISDAEALDFILEYINEAELEYAVLDLEDRIKDSEKYALDEE